MHVSKILAGDNAIVGVIYRMGFQGRNAGRVALHGDRIESVGIRVVCGVETPGAIDVVSDS